MFAQEQTYDTARHDTHTDTHTHTHTHIYTHIHTHTHLHTNIARHTHTHSTTHTQPHTHIAVRVNTTVPMNMSPAHLFNMEIVEFHRVPLVHADSSKTGVDVAYCQKSQKLL